MHILWLRETSLEQKLCVVAWIILYGFNPKRVSQCLSTLGQESYICLRTHRIDAKKVKGNKMLKSPRMSLHDSQVIQPYNIFD